MWRRRPFNLQGRASWRQSPRRRQIVWRKIRDESVWRSDLVQLLFMTRLSFHKVIERRDQTHAVIRRKLSYGSTGNSLKTPRPPCHTSVILPQSLYITFIRQFISIVYIYWSTSWIRTQNKVQVTLDCVTDWGTFIHFLYLIIFPISAMNLLKFWFVCWTHFLFIAAAFYRGAKNHYLRIVTWV